MSNIKSEWMIINKTQLKKIEKSVMRCFLSISANLSEVSLFDIKILSIADDIDCNNKFKLIAQITIDAPIEYVSSDKNKIINKNDLKRIERFVMSSIMNISKQISEVVLFDMKLYDTDDTIKSPKLIAKIDIDIPTMLAVYK